MPLRDILIVGMVLFSIPHVLRRPWLGVLLWFWISLMNPHRLCWAFAYNMPLAQIAAFTLVIGIVLGRDKLSIPRHWLVIVWVLFIFWMVVTTLMAIDPSLAEKELDRSLKIQVMTLPVLLLINDRKRVTALVAVMAFSIGFYGIKGGVFALRTGLAGTVWGPPDSFITGNNELGLALLMVVPLMWFLHMHVDPKWQKRVILGSILLCLLSVISTYSRGAFLAMAVMGVFLLLKSRQRLLVVVAAAVVIPLVLVTAPEKWFDRMGTIENYQEDESAMGRISAWTMAIHMAKDRPLFGGGFGAFNRANFRRYNPGGSFHDAHSIYFEVLGEMGFVGLGLFVIFFFTAYRVAGRTAKRARGSPQLQWAADLCLMLQVSLISYGSGGAFLGLAYFDLPYALAALALVMQRLVDQELARERVVAPEAPFAPPAAQPAYEVRMSGRR